MKTTVKDGENFGFSPMPSPARCRELREDSPREHLQHSQGTTLQIEDLASSMMMEPHKTYQKNGTSRLLQGLTQLSGDSTRRAIKGRDNGKHGKNLRKFTDKNAVYESVPDVEDDDNAEKEFDEEGDSDQSDEESDQSDDEQTDSVF